MPKENKDNCRAIFLELEDLEEGSSLASEVTLLWGPGKGEDKLWKCSRPGGHQDTEVEMLGQGRASSRAGEGRETGQPETNWQPASRTQAGQAVRTKRQPASGTPDTASSRRPQSSSQRRNHLGLPILFPTQEPGMCRLLLLP
ncbi:unnamed protein product [Rangifer tarandus platyrhynchus]|uniref:Uncharacterized protein n=2 Tax=Rangifer tarandus platyrhynchus TaxID=3082113 RepID=A0ABN8ZLU5_RANTA|nr:unnamed protein product [Rangifer tarandus platyrhynchus]